MQWMCERPPCTKVARRAVDANGATEDPPRRVHDPHQHHRAQVRQVADARPPSRRAPRRRCPKGARQPAVDQQGVGVTSCLATLRQVGPRVRWRRSTAQVDRRCAHHRRPNGGVEWCSSGARLRDATTPLEPRDGPHQTWDERLAAPPELWRCTRGAHRVRAHEIRCQ